MKNLEVHRMTLSDPSLITNILEKNYKNIKEVVEPNQKEDTTTKPKVLKENQKEDVIRQKSVFTEAHDLGLVNNDCFF